MSQLPTRRFAHAVLEDRAVLAKCRLSALAKRPEGRLLRQLNDASGLLVAWRSGGGCAGGAYGGAGAGRLVGRRGGGGRGLAACPRALGLGG